MECIVIAVGDLEDNPKCLRSSSTNYAWAAPLLAYNNGVNTHLQPQHTRPKTHVFPLPRYWVFKTILRELLLSFFYFY